METDRDCDEGYLLSSDTESEFGDENNLFYDEQAKTQNEIKFLLDKFDSDKSGLTPIYQEKFLPKLKDRSHNFMKWLIETDLLSSIEECPNSRNNPLCKDYMEFVLAVGVHDFYQLRCKNCGAKESIRKSSIFQGLKCNLRSVIRALYGWVKGTDLEFMANMLGLERKIIGIIYNRAARIALSCMSLCPGLGDFGGEGVLVLIDIHPHILEDENTLKKICRPILCILEIESIPQKYWLEPLEFWDNNNPEQVKKVKEKVMDAIFTLVKPESIPVLPKDSTLSFSDCMDKFYEKYECVKYMDDLQKLCTDTRPLSTVLETIWKAPLSICEEAQFFNPDYVSQFLVRHMWNEMTGADSFILLISFIVYETRVGNIESYF